MQAIGDTLREARMRQKVDMADVEAATKIRAKYLRALENEEFDLLPGPTFVRSFLRTYSEYLGLDAHLLVEAYRSQYEPRPDETELQPFTSPQRRARERVGGRYKPPPRGRGGALVAVALVGLLAFFLILGLTGGEDDSGTSADQAGDTAEQAAEARRERAARRRARERREEREAAKPRQVSLRVVPADATYVCVDNGAGKTLFEGTIAEPRTWKGRRLRLNLGKQSASVRVNGKAVRLDGGPNPVGFDFTLNGRKELPEGRRPCA